MDYRSLRNKILRSLRNEGRDKLRCSITRDGHLILITRDKKGRFKRRSMPIDNIPEHAIEKIVTNRIRAFNDSYGADIS